MQVGERLDRDPASTIGGVTFEFLIEDENDGKGKLLAWDPVTQKARWSVPRLSMVNGGIMATGGNLVFQGTEDGRFQAVDATTGKILWDFGAHHGIMASPATYTVRGAQYISILAGYGSIAGGGASFLKGGWKWGAQPRRLLTFKMGGMAALPNDLGPDFSVHPTADKNLVLDEAAVPAGSDLYKSKNCAVCHGFNVRSAGAPAPDLRESRIASDKAAFTEVLRVGTLAPAGMPRYSELSDSEIHSLYTYIRATTREAAGGAKIGAQQRGSSF
jgi:quinohemoprotein ethanol dehydrogenase